MAFARSLPPVSLVAPTTSVEMAMSRLSSSTTTLDHRSLRSCKITLHTHSHNLSSLCRFRKIGHSKHKASFAVRAELRESEDILAAYAFAIAQVKHVLLPITNRNPYLSEGTRQAAATTAALAKKFGADITVVVIDEKSKESIPEHEAQLSSIRWHLSEGGFREFGLMERLGEGKKPTAIIGHRYPASPLFRGKNCSPLISQPLPPFLLSHHHRIVAGQPSFRRCYLKV